MNTIFGLEQALLWSEDRWPGSDCLTDPHVVNNSANGYITTSPRGKKTTLSKSALTESRADKGLHTYTNQRQQENIKNKLGVDVTCLMFGINWSRFGIG